MGMMVFLPQIISSRILGANFLPNASLKQLQIRRRVDPRRIKGCELKNGEQNPTKQGLCLEYVKINIT